MNVSVMLMLIPALLVTGCRQGTSEANGAGPSESDIWQRRKDCADQAGKFAADYESKARANEIQARANSPNSSWNDFWTDHYSRKYNGCFVKFFSVEMDGNRIVRSHDILVDAFERSTLALSTSAPSAHICDIGGNHGDCAKVDSFIKDHMNN